MTARYSPVFSVRMSLEYLNPFPPSLILPSYLVAGDTWTFSLSRGPNTDGETATMTFGAGTVTFNQAAVADDQAFTFTFPGTVTGVAPGPYRYSIAVTDPAGNRNTVQTGGIPVIANPATDQWVKTESFLQKAIREIEQLILDLLNQRVSMVSFGGKQYYLWDVEKLWRMRNELVARAAAEDAAMLGNRRANVILPLFVNR
jgi:hypothetical protein